MFLIKWIQNHLNLTNLTLAIITILLLILYQCVLKNWWYFSKRNVKFIRGWPILGSLHQMFMGQESFPRLMQTFYKQFPNERFFGIYEITHPIFVIRDPDLIKQITVQDFDHFVNHQGNFDVEVDSLLARSLFFSRDQAWKDMRTILSPAFTGNKMRSMFELIRECTTEFMLTLKTSADETQTNGAVYELKDLLSRYATNIIATCAFGLKVDAITNRDDEFFLAGKKVTNFDGWQGIKFLLFDSIPTVMKLVGVKFFDAKLMDYFRGVVKSAVGYREKNNVFRPDMIQLLMQAKKGTLEDDGNGSKSKIKREWHDDDLAAQCIVFFFAGFETMSTLLCFMSHELACNPDVQQKLYAEIEQIDQELNGAPITYEMVQKLKYMDMVVSETLRLWPPIPGIDRQVTRSYRLENNDGTTVDLTTHDAVWFAIYGIHTDAEYWPQPNKFDPQRFSDENRQNIKVCSYLPFGNGQRSCIASRFALMVAKTVFYFILKEYSIEKCDKTPEPLILKTSTINMMAKDGFWIEFKPRKVQSN